MRRVAGSWMRSGTIAEASQTSPLFPELGDKGLDRGSARVGARRAARKQRPGGRGATRPHESVAQARDVTGITAERRVGDRLEADCPGHVEPARRRAVEEP